MTPDYVKQLAMKLQKSLSMVQVDLDSVKCVEVVSQMFGFKRQQYSQGDTNLDSQNAIGQADSEPVSNVYGETLKSFSENPHFQRRIGAMIDLSSSKEQSDLFVDLEERGFTVDWGEKRDVDELWKKALLKEKKASITRFSKMNSLNGVLIRVEICPVLSGKNSQGVPVAGEWIYRESLHEAFLEASQFSRNYVSKVQAGSDTVS